MSLIAYFQVHWLDWLSGGLAAAAVWIAAQWIAKPIVEFLSDRRLAIEVVQQHGSVDGFASEETMKTAQASIATAAKRIMFYAQGGPQIVRLYSRIRAYDLRVAGLALNGLIGIIGTNASREQFKDQCDAVRVCLGATGMMSLQRKDNIRSKVLQSREHVSAVNSSGTK